MNIFLDLVRNKIKFTTALKISLVLFVVFCLFHFFIIIGILIFDFVPLDYLWGGRMETREELFVFEIISFVVQALCIWIVLLKGQNIKNNQNNVIVNLVIWILCFVFFLNTIGNIIAKTNLEKGFTLVTGILFILMLRIGLEKKIEKL